MEDNLNGYVIYQKDEDTYNPLGVVSKNHECSAICSNIPSFLKNYLIQFEDKRFYNHNGIDFYGLVRAILENIKAGKIVQGGSTITQQLARNILKDNSKSYLRKIREAIKAIELENKLTKDEILLSYFNEVYFGKNIRGIRAAGLYYFDKEMNRLSKSELLFLLTILRGPNYYLSNKTIANNRYQFLSRKLLTQNLITSNRHKKNIKNKLTLKDKKLFPINEKVICFISSKIDTKTIYSTIDKKAQIFSNEFVKNSKYPISIIILKKGSVIGFSSSYGADYPFVLKSNVGSTLKPFLYCYLRENGINKNDEYLARNNNSEWKVREAKIFENKISISNALFQSNNNAFINASLEVGMSNSLLFLSKILNKNIESFYPSSILGASRDGISLFDLGIAYSNFFCESNLTPIKNECLTILNKIAKEKLKLDVDNIFLKTGTTNDNKENLAIIQQADLTFAILRNENPKADNSKDGNLMRYSRMALMKWNNFINPNSDYKW